MKRIPSLVLLLCLLLLASGLSAPRTQAEGQITSPRDRASVRGLVPIEGTVTHPQFQKYELQYGPEPNPGDQWTSIQGSPFAVPVVQGRLGLWDTTVIPDGVYSLRLRLVRTDSNYDEYFVRGILVANSSPTETPAPRATPTPSAPTATPQPTPTIIIGVPTVSSPTPKPTDTPLPTEPATATPPPPDLPFGITSIGDAAVRGAGITVALFAGIGLFFALKAVIASLVRWITGRDREDAV